MRRPWDPKQDWWPQRSAQPGQETLWQQPSVDGAASGTTTLTTTSGTTDALRAVQTKLCSAVFDKPVPCTVHIRVQPTNQQRSSWDFAAVVDPSGVAAAASSAKLIFEYGAGAALRRVTCDLRPGAYQLPPCDQVTVYIQVSDDTPV